MALLDKYFAAKDGSGKVKDVWTKIPSKDQAKGGDIPDAVKANDGTGTNYFDVSDELQTGFVPNAPGTIPPGNAEGLDDTKDIPNTTDTIGSSRWKGAALGYAFRDPSSAIASLYNFFKAKGARSTDEVYHQYAPLTNSTYIDKLPTTTQTRAKSDIVVSTPNSAPTA